MSNDHYVPRLYLKNFASDEAKSFIYSYRKGDMTKVRPISRVASENDYYTINESEHAATAKNNNDYLSKVENDSAPIISNILDKNRLPAHITERISLAYFVATLSTRTPLIHEYFKGQIIRDKKDILKFGASNKEEFYLLMKTVDENTSDEEIEATRQIYLQPEGHLKFDFAENDYNKSHVRSLLATVQSQLLAKRLLSSYWHLLIDIFPK